MCRRRFSGIVYVWEHWGQRCGLSSSWFLKWALYLLSLSNSIPHKSHVWTPCKTITENISRYTLTFCKQYQCTKSCHMDHCGIQCLRYTVNNKLILSSVINWNSFQQKVTSQIQEQFYGIKICNLIKAKVKVLQSHKVHRAAMFSDSVALSQTPAEAASPQTWDKCVTWQRQQGMRNLHKVFT